MHHRIRFSVVSPIVPIVLVLMLVLVFSCSDQPVGTDQDNGEGGLSGSGEIDPGAGGTFLLGTVSDDSFAPGYIEVWAMEVSFDTLTGIVSFDVQLSNHTRRNIPPPIHFVVTDILPRDIAVVEFDGVTGDGFPFYDFSAKLGDDNLLESGERTEPVTMKFHTVEPRSFAIGFRIDLGPPEGDGMIGGVVYRDDNKNGLRDEGEPGIPGIVVALEKPHDDNDEVVLLTRTDVEGRYHFCCFDEGVYEVFVGTAYESEWDVTSTNPLLITLVAGPGGQVQSFLEAHFGLFPLHPPPPDNLFGPILVGPYSPVGTLLDSTFVNPPSLMPVEFTYYLDVMLPPYMGPYIGIVDSASAWINDEQVFGYHRAHPPDTALFEPRTIELPDGLVEIGENTIRLFTDGTGEAALMWRVYKEPQRERAL